MERNAALDKLIDHYSEKFELSRNVELAGMTVPVVASLRHRGTLSILGFGTGKKGPEACEHIFMVECESVDSAMLEKVAELFAQAERAYVTPDENHAYTFLSVILIARDMQKAATALLKKYKFRREYNKAGWMLARVAVIDESGAVFCNKDGTDLKNLIIKILK